MHTPISVIIILLSTRYIPPVGKSVSWYSNNKANQFVPVVLAVIYVV